MFSLHVSFFVHLPFKARTALAHHAELSYVAGHPLVDEKFILFGKKLTYWDALYSRCSCTQRPHKNPDPEPHTSLRCPNHNLNPETYTYPVRSQQTTIFLWVHSVSKAPWIFAEEVAIWRQISQPTDVVRHLILINRDGPTEHGPFLTDVALKAGCRVIVTSVYLWLGVSISIVKPEIQKCLGNSVEATTHAHQYYHENLPE